MESAAQRKRRDTVTVVATFSAPVDGFEAADVARAPRTPHAPRHVAGGRLQLLLPPVAAASL